MAENFGNVFFQLCICFVSLANLPRPRCHVSPPDLPQSLQICCVGASRGMLYEIEWVSPFTCLFFWQIVISLQVWKTSVLALALKEGKKSSITFLKHFESWLFEGLGKEIIYTLFQGDLETGNVVEETEVLSTCICALVLLSTAACDKWQTE